jgi:heme-binding protein
VNLKRVIPGILLGGGVVVAAASLLFHPYMNLKGTTSTDPLLATADVDPIVFAIVQRSCQNCHSEKTEWPWYSYVAPMSWLVESDVGEARSRMNISRWYQYSAEQRQQLLARIGAMVRNRQMPPDRYTMIHPDAKLSPMERDQIYEWTRKERRRLKSAETLSEGTGQ